MDIPMEQSFASVVRYVQEKADKTADFIYKNIPENFQVPSVYFQVPTATSRKATLSAYLTILNVDIWFLHRGDWDANAAAVQVRNSILLDNLHIPIRNEDGSLSGKCLHIEEPEVRKIDEGIVQLSIRVKSYTKKPETALAQAERFQIIWNRITAYKA